MLASISCIFEILSLILPNKNHAKKHRVRRMKDNVVPKFISHIRKNPDGEIAAYQSNEEHCLGVAILARQFASEFGMGDWGYALGLLHDKGKEKKEFQDYIRDVNGISGHKGWTPQGKAHAYVGALLAQKLYGKSAMSLFCNPICGHHAGLYDYCELVKKISSDTLPPEIDQSMEKVTLSKTNFNPRSEQIHHLIRVLFSCLVDADYLDTERFMDEYAARTRLPTDLLQPMVDSLKSYLNMFGVSVLFTTASQPLLNGIIEGCNPRVTFRGIENITEIIPRDYALHEKLRRVCLQIDNTGRTYDEIAERVSRHSKVLCIVNTRGDAREIYERLPNEGLTIHLSRMMCPRHVSGTIERIKRALQDGTEPVIRVVATQLIEAGVDIDFPVVYRQEAGLDSILQAAGRCNREGKLDMATTYVFSLSKEHNLHGSVVDANDARLSMTGVDDWFSPETMTEYFRQLYGRKDTFDKKDIKALLYKPSEMCFAEAAKEFRLIEEAGKTVYVNMDDSLELVERLKSDGITYSLMKQLSQYSVNIHERDFQKLLGYGAIEEVIDGIYVVNDRAQYDENIGLRLDNHWMNEILTI